MTEFSIENPTKIMEIESFLANNAYLSGEALPNQEDSRILGLLKDIPERSKYPNLFSWWWNLCSFQESARNLWGDAKKVEKKVEKKEEKKEESDSDDDLLDSGDEDDEKVKALKAEMEKKAKKAEKSK